jgi:hypothetical protein
MTTINDKLEIIQKAVKAYFKVLFQHSPGGREKTTKILRISLKPRLDLLNKRAKHCHLVWVSNPIHFEQM